MDLPSQKGQRLCEKKESRPWGWQESLRKKIEGLLRGDGVEDHLSFSPVQE